MQDFFKISCLVLWFYIPQIGISQSGNFTRINCDVDFNKVIHSWDGFGVNYVETSQTPSYSEFRQDYGSLSLLSRESKEDIFHLIFGKEGLEPDLLKMFLDPLHQKGENQPYDHRTTTASMLEFAHAGINLYKKEGKSLSVITTLYGPPAYITQQKVIRGRDLDTSYRYDLAHYLISWVKFLQEEKIPVGYLSLNNEGECWLRWPQNGGNGELVAREGHDYNFFWPPSQVVEFLGLMRPLMDKAGLKEVGLTNGEPTNWYRFAAWGYADAIIDHPEALKNLGLVTSHGFYVGGMEDPRWFGPHTSRGVDLIRSKKPELHAWVTSTAWNSIRKDSCHDNKIIRYYSMDAEFIKQIHGNIYEAKVNGLIPWACMQNASHWNRPDPNPGCAIRVYDDGSYEIQKGYYYYKQVTRAGKAGMKVAHTSAMDSEIAIIAFAKGSTQNPNSFVVVNYGKNNRDLTIRINGNHSGQYRAYRTSGSQIYSYRSTAASRFPEGENYAEIAPLKINNHSIQYSAPANSVTTFFEE